MLQTLLADRFRLTTHTERRDLPVFVLAMVSTDETPGLQLRRSGFDCAPLASWAPPATVAPPISDSSEPCGAVFAAGRLTARQMTMGQLANGLSMLLGRPVLDRTGLQGRFDLDLDAQGRPTSDALQEQLGLNLDIQPMQVDVLVIDDVQLPTTP
jgi:uncharacterized protein (TIGR03435 family)